jgi:selenocysteine-specific elongation factor
VTGTLARGALSAGEDVDVLPTPRGETAQAKVRALQVHGKSVNRAEAPTRVAVNLRGADDDALARGAAIATRGWQRPTRVFVAEIELLPWAEALARRASLTVHAGTAQRPGRVALAEPLEPGGRAIARISLRVPISAYAGLRVVLRRPELARDRTVGGGVILDPHPRRARGAAQAPSGVLGFVEEARYAGVDADEIARRSPPGVDVRAAVADLERSGKVTLAEGRLYLAALVAEAEKEALACVAALHAERPLTAGVARAEIETRLAPRLRALAPAALASLVGKKALVADGAVVRLASRSGPSGEVFDKLGAIYAKAALAPPLDEEARAALGVELRPFKDALAELKRRGSLRLLGNGLHFDVAALDALKGRVADHLARTPTMTPVDFKALCGGLSRKYAIPLLEWLDAQGVTRRQGDTRVAGPAARK